MNLPESLLLIIFAEKYKNDILANPVLIPYSLRTRIDATRFLMMMLVIMIHGSVLSYMDAAQAPFAATLIEYFTLAWTGMGVPFFFFISAYLMQTLHPDVRGVAYSRLVRSRCRSILIPYLLWNSLAIIFWTAIHLSPAGQYTSGGVKFVSVWQTLDYAFLQPAVYPLWFLRNLMCFILTVPVSQFILRKSPALLLLIGFVLENYTPASGFLFYASGMIAAELWSPREFENSLSRLSPLAVFYSLGVLCLMITGGDPAIRFPLAQVLDIAGFLGFMALFTRTVTRGGKLGKPEAVFFVYALHGIISPYVLKALRLLYPWTGDGWLLANLLSITGIAAVSYGAYFMLRRVCPRLLAPLLGNR